MRLPTLTISKKDKKQKINIFLHLLNSRVAKMEQTVGVLTYKAI